MSQWEKPRELVDAERKNRNSTDDDDVVILAETAWKSDIEKTKDDDEPMIVEELICVDGPVKESTRSDIIEPEEAFLDENAGPENPSRRMRTEERKNNKSHEGDYFETCDGVEEFMKKEQEKELLEDDIEILAETPGKSEKEKNKDDVEVEILAETCEEEKTNAASKSDVPMIVKDVISVDGPSKDSSAKRRVGITRSDIIEPGEYSLDKNAGPEQPWRKMRKEEEERNNNKVKLREIVVDGSNVSMALGKGRFCVEALSIVYDYFAGRGHQVSIFLPQSRWNKSNDEEREVLDWLEFGEDALHYTPTRRTDKGSYDCYDDRFMVEYAVSCQGIIVTNDNYRDLINESAAFRDQIVNRYRHSFRIISANHITSGCFLLPG